MTAMKLPATLLKSQNDVTALLAMLYSAEGLATFEQMADNTFSIAWGELTSDEAHALLRLVGISGQIQVMLGQQPTTLSFMPLVVLKGLGNAYAALSPYHSLLVRIEAGEISPLEAKIQAGEIAIGQRQSIVMSPEQITTLLENGAKH